MLATIKNCVENLTAHGTAVVCPCCGHTARRFFPAGVITKRSHARCAFCNSLERHRLAALMLQKNKPTQNIQLLSIAPEEPLSRFFKNTYNAHITTSDLLRNDVDVKADVCALPFANASFDMIIANHVLEHVFDDSAAMRELHRVIKPGGQALLQTPIHWDNATTDEDIAASPNERLRRFGQEDHVRLYGRDFVARLTQAGWNAEAVVVKDIFSPDEIKKYGLIADEVFFKIFA